MTRPALSESVRAAPIDLPPVPRQVWQLAVVVVIGSFMTTLDSSLINVALDTITRTFHATRSKRAMDQ